MRSPGLDSRGRRRGVGLDLSDDVGLAERRRRRRTPRRSRSREGNWPSGRRARSGSAATPGRTGMRARAALRECCRASAGVLAGAHVADELHVAAERQPADLPARPLLVGPAERVRARSRSRKSRPEPRTAAPRDSGRARGRRRAARARRRTRAGPSTAAVAASIMAGRPSSPRRRAAGVKRSISSTSAIEPRRGEVRLVERLARRSGRCR